MGAADLQRIPSGFVRETPTNIDGRHRALDHQTTAGEALPVLRPRRAASPLHRNKKRHSHSRSPTATPAPSDLFMAVPASRIRSTSCLRFLTSGLLNCGAPLSARAVASPLSPSDTASSQAASCGRTRLFKGTMTTASTFTSRAVAAATAGPSQAVGAGRPPPSHAQLLFARPGLTRPVSGGGWTSSPVLLLRVQRNHSLLTSSSRQYSSQVLTVSASPNPALLPPFRYIAALCRRGPLPSMGLCPCILSGWGH